MKRFTDTYTLYYVVGTKLAWASFMMRLKLLSYSFPIIHLPPAVLVQLATPKIEANVQHFHRNFPKKVATLPTDHHASEGERRRRGWAARASNDGCAKQWSIILYRACARLDFNSLSYGSICCWKWSLLSYAWGFLSGKTSGVSYGSSAALYFSLCVSTYVTRRRREEIS